MYKKLHGVCDASDGGSESAAEVLIINRSRDLDVEPPVVQHVHGPLLENRVRKSMVRTGGQKEEGILSAMGTKQKVLFSMVAISCQKFLETILE